MSHLPAYGDTRVIHGVPTKAQATSVEVRGVPTRAQLADIKASGADTTTDMVARRRYADALDRRARAHRTSATPSAVSLENPTVWTVLRSYTISLPGTGPFRVRAGLEIVSPQIIAALKEVGADIHPVR